jgi:hypothetical protein
MRTAELSFSPQPKRKAGGGGHLEELNSPSKRLRFTFWENGGQSDMAKPISRLSDCLEIETTELVGKDDYK